MRNMDPGGETPTQNTWIKRSGLWYVGPAYTTTYNCLNSFCNICPAGGDSAHCYMFSTGYFFDPVSGLGFGCPGTVTECIFWKVEN